MRLPSRRLVIGGAAVLVSLAVLGAWAPWQDHGRKQWSAAPAVPAALRAPERVWLEHLARWIGFVRDSAEDPTSLTVKECGARLSRLDPAPARLRATRALAADTCGAYTAQASDRAGSQLSWDPGRAGKANAEEREAANDMQLLVATLKLHGPPGGRVVVQYSRIASRLSGRAATARCWNSEANWTVVERALARTEPGLRNLEGFAVPGLSRIELSPGVCRTLDAVARSARPGRLAEINAIEVLTHEAEHLVGPDGNSDEAAVDCYAAQRLRTTARLLGLPAVRTAHMGDLYLALLQPRLPLGYRSPECRRGGRYDLTPRDGRWP